ncbi:hypothetical protein EV1_001610 [Malus domestica]
MPNLVLHHPPLTSFLSHLPSSSSSSSSSFPIQTQKSTASFSSTNHTVLLRWRPNTIRYMVNPRRVAMVAKQIKKELSDMLLTDKVLQYTILPEVSLGADRYLSLLTTISDVEVSTDLQDTFLMNRLWGGTLSWRTHGCSTGVLVSRASTNEEHMALVKARTFRCPPTVAAEKTSNEIVLSQKLSCQSGKKALRRGRLIRCISISQFQMDVFC